MPSWKAALAGFSTASILAAIFGIGLWFVVRANARADAAEQRAVAAEKATAQADERRLFAEQQIGFVTNVAKKALDDRLAAEAKTAGFAAELARVKKAAGKGATVVAAGSGTSAPLPAGPGLFSKGDTGKFHLQVGGVTAEHGTLAIATWAQAYNASTNALLFEGSVPLTVDYTPPPPAPAEIHAGYGLYAGFAVANGKLYRGIGPGTAFRPWEVWKFRVQLSGGIGVWPDVVGGALLLGSMQ